MLCSLIPALWAASPRPNQICRLAAIDILLMYHIRNQSRTTLLNTSNRYALTRSDRATQEGIEFHILWSFLKLQTLTTQAHLKQSTVHQTCALAVLTMIRVLAYTLSLVFYHRQVVGHARQTPPSFSEMVRLLAYLFLPPTLGLQLRHRANPNLHVPRGVPRPTTFCQLKAAVFAATLGWQEPLPNPPYGGKVGNQPTGQPDTSRRSPVCEIASWTNFSLDTGTLLRHQ
jgi:hypothetical protein